MRFIAGRIVLAASTSFLLLMCYVHHRDSAVMAQEKSAVTATRLYTGDDGLTHVEQVELKFSPVPGAPATLAESEHMKATSAYIVRVPPGFFEGWHNADAHRYVIPLSGRAEIEVAGGQKVLAEPGRICEAGDLKGKGHTFRVLGKDDWVALFVDFAQ